MTPPPLVPPRIPALPLALLRVVLPRAERREVIADLRAEYAEQVTEHGEAMARRWLWRQALSSVPPMLTWNLWRESTGFEPTANAFRPGGPILQHLFPDIRYALRRLRMRASYAVLAVLTLALGIGGTAAVFGIARPLVLDPLPYANERDVASFWMRGSWTEQEFVYLRGKFPGFRSVAAYRPTDFTLQTGAEPARLVSAIEASAELFDVLGAKPMIGRGFQTGDDAQGAEPAVVVSYGLWNELGGDQSVLGMRLTIDGSPRTVIGVMPRGFWFPSPSVRIWVPRTLDSEARNGSYSLVGHVAQSEDPANMTGQISRLVPIIAERFTYSRDWDKIANAHVFPLRDVLIGPMKPAIYATFVTMGLILLIACTNVAALMLGQVESRASELAVRAALGANRRRLTQPLVVEALIIGVFAAALGAGLAAGGFGLLAGALPIGEWAASATFDWTLFAIALVIAVGAALLVVLIPSASLWRRDAGRSVQAALSRIRTGGVQGGSARVERALVVVEVALAMLIASSATLLVRSVVNLYAIDPGVDTRGFAVVDVMSNSSSEFPARRIAIEQAVAAASAIPGVKSAAATMKLPLRGPGNSFSVLVEGRENQERSSTYFRIVTSGYLATMGVTVKEGRTFDASDRPGGAEVSIVINEALAKKYFPGENPIGRRMNEGFNVPQRIVGIVADVAEASLTDKPSPVRYFLAGQVPWFSPRATIVIRTANEASAEAILDEARAAINRAAPALAVQGTTTMSRVFDGAVGPARQVMALLAVLSALALVLGAVGIYGVISHFAARHKRDWAIRVALGLSGPRVVLNILGQGATLVAMGIAIGGAGTVVLSRLLSTFLFGVKGVDPIAFAAATAALLATGLIAAFVPARRAGAVDPALVLREEA